MIITYGLANFAQNVETNQYVDKLWYIYHYSE